MSATRQENTGGESRVITNEAVADKTKLGYLRISSIEQDEARHLKVFDGIGLYKIFVEKISTKEPKRPILRQMIDYTKSGDVVYIKNFSRLARSTKDLLETAQELINKGVRLVSLKEGLDTETQAGMVMLDTIKAVYEFERENTVERQREGIDIAKRQGKFKGRKEIDKPEKWKEIYKKYQNRSITGAEAMDMLKLKRNTFYKFVKAEKNQVEQGETN